MTALHPSIQLEVARKLARRKNIIQKGFTLVELLVTVAILGTLSAIALPAFFEYQKEAVASQNNTEAMAKARDCVAQMGSPSKQAALKAASVAVNTCTDEGGTFTANNDSTKANQAEASASSDGEVKLDTPSVPL